MIDALKEEIAARLDNIDTLPKKTKKDKAKVSSLLDDALNHYQELMDQTLNEINERYDAIINVPSEVDIPKLKSDVLDFNFVKEIDVNVNSFYKMNLDYLIFKLMHFYKDDLNTANTVIRQIVDKFSEVGIELTHKDFRITNYVHTYMQAILNNDVNINQVFNQIYWECPNFIIQIVINVYYLYFDNLKKINKHYSKVIRKSISLDNYVADKTKDYYLERNTNHHDRALIIERFRNKEISIADFTIQSIDKIKTAILSKEANYTDLLMFEETLNDYQVYLKYQFIIEDVKKIYADKKSYKGIFATKLKEIIKLEKTLIKLSKKSLKLKDEKLDEAKLKSDNLVNEIYEKYRELDDLFVKDDIFNYINDQNSWLDILRVVVNNFNYMENILTNDNPALSLPEVEEQINEIKKTLYGKHSDILDNLKVASLVNVPRIIADKYKLLNFIIDEEKLNKDDINTYLKNTDILLTNFDMANVGLKYEDIDYLLNVDKTIKK